MQYHHISNENNNNHESAYQDICNLLLLYIIFIHKTCPTLLWSCMHAALFTQTNLTSGRHVVSQHHLRLPYKANWTVVYSMLGKTLSKPVRRLWIIKILIYQPDRQPKDRCPSYNLIFFGKFRKYLLKT
jgi:hypothetical protein